ncbi:MAG TPA: (d)CMP kinase [Spirochaetia bacterium]|nr:(d)CMP kinase [Spirochaetia bacterium]
MLKIITIDGPAGSGKTTIAKLLSNRIGFSHLDTGSIYRAITMHFLEKNIQSKEIERIAEQLRQIDITINENKIFINSHDVSEKIRSREINNAVALYAKIPEVRDFVRKIQKTIAMKGGYIVDGRDIGSVVFPEAFCKFYLDASSTVRALRRLNDNKEVFKGKSLDEVEKEIKERDEIDQKRVVSPLIIPADAMVIDSSALDIDEVMQKMIAFFNERIDILCDHRETSAIAAENSEELFKNALQNFTSQAIPSGEICEGKIIQITNDGIFLDIKAKTDAFLPFSDFKNTDKSAYKTGDTIEVVIVDRTSARITVSRQKALHLQGIEAIKKSLSDGSTVNGKIIEAIKGGYVVDITESRAFCPYSEFMPGRIDDTQNQCGRIFQFKVLEFSPRRLVVSHKAVVAENSEKNLKKFFSERKNGDIVNCTVKKILAYGMFAEISEGVDGFIHNSNISWDRADTAEKLFKAGDTINARILLLDTEKKRIDLSLRDLQEDPFVRYINEHQQNDLVKGQAVKIQSYGAIIELAKGVDGYIHITEMSWTRHVNHPREILKEGDFVEAKIIEIIPAERRIRLSLRQITDNPWTAINEKYPINTVIEAEVKAIINSGVFFRIDADYEGFLEINDISWVTEKIHLKEKFKKGAKEKAKIIGYNSDKHYIQLGIKQLTENPYQGLRRSYGINGIVQGKVVKILPGGAFISLPGGIDGFCPISYISENRIEKIEDELALNTECSFLIKEIDEARRKILLSRRDSLRAEARVEMQKYMKAPGMKEGFSLADVFKNNQI